VVTLPWSSAGSSMLWQAECGMCFRNVGGWTGIARFDVARWPIVNYFAGAHDIPEPELQLKTFLANNGVTAIVIDDANRHASEWTRLMSCLDIAPSKAGGVSIYRVDQHALAKYRGVTGLAMEQRAEQKRFEMLLDASRRYVEAGGNLEEIGIPRLVDAGLLPAEWKQASDGYSDAHVLSWKPDGITIIQIGSRSAMRSIVDRYRADASIVYQPFPQIVPGGTATMTPLERKLHNLVITPAAMPIDGESQMFIGLAFSRAQLMRTGSAAADPIASAEAKRN
jgi:hypothetical protein